MARPSYWLNFAIPGAIGCGTVAVGLGVRHVATMGSRPFSWGWVVCLGIALGALANVLCLVGFQATEKGTYPPTRTRWMYAAVGAGLLLGFVGFLLSIAGDNVSDPGV